MRLTSNKLLQKQLGSVRVDSAGQQVADVSRFLACFIQRAQKPGGRPLLHAALQLKRIA
jgi:hypothetical protein